MKEYAYSTLDIAWIIDGMTLGCRRQYQVMETIWQKEKTYLELKYLESYRRFVLEIQYWMHYLHEKNLLDQEFTAIQQEIAALNHSMDLCKQKIIREIFLVWIYFLSRLVFVFYMVIEKTM